MSGSAKFVPFSPANPKSGNPQDADSGPTSTFDTRYVEKMIDMSLYHTIIDPYIIIYHHFPLTSLSSNALQYSDS